MEGGISQERTTNAKRRNTNYRIGEEGANEEVENDVMDLISQVHLKLSVQLESRVRDAEAATHCTLFQLRGSAIVTEMHSAGRAYDELVNTQPSVERGSPHIWFVHRNAEGKRVGFEDHAMTPSQDQEKAEAVRVLQATVEGQQPPGSKRKRRVLGTSESHTRRWRMCWPRRETDLTNGGCTRGSQSRTF